MTKSEPTPAPAEAPKVEEKCAYCHHAKELHYEKGCGVCMDLTFPRCREYKPAPKVGSPPSLKTPATASVTPASDAEVAAYQKEYDGYKSVTLTSASQIMRLIARIEQEKAANAELRAQVKRCHALLQGFVSCTDPEAEPELCGDASKELGGEFCPGSCTTSCDADRDADRAEIAQLRARLAEVSEAAQQVADVRPDLPNTLREAVNVLEAILAKGDTK